MIAKLGVTDLIDRMREYAALSYMIDLDGIFAFAVGKFTAEEIAARTIKGCIVEALREFELYTPLYLCIRLDGSLAKGNGKYTFIDNFDQYLNGIIDSEWISLIPSAVINIHPTGQLYSLSGNRTPWYDQSTHQLSMVQGGGGFSFSSAGGLSAYCICSRPVIWELDEKGKYTDRSGIYFMDTTGAINTKFIEWCNLKVIQRIIDLKNNLTLPGFPVEMFGSLDERYSTLRSELDEWGRANITRGKLVL